MDFYDLVNDPGIYALARIAAPGPTHTISRSIFGFANEGELLRKAVETGYARQREGAPDYSKIEPDDLSAGATAIAQALELTTDGKVALFYQFRNEVLRSLPNGDPRKQPKSPEQIAMRKGVENRDPATVDTLWPEFERVFREEVERVSVMPHA